MARTQAKILCSIWTDPDFTALTSDAQRLYLLILSQPRLNIAGCIDVMPERWARLCAGGSLEGVQASLTELQNARFVVVDGDELVVRTFVTHDLGSGALNRNLVKGMWSAWAGIMSPTLRKVVVDNVPDRLWEIEGVEVPDQAKQLRSEPQFEPQSEPQIEPSVDLLPAPCSLLPATSSSLRTTPVPDPPERSHHDEAAAPAPDPDPTPAVDLEQTIRRTAVLVGRTVAAHRPGTVNPTGYAAGVTRQILDPNGDGIDRTRIERLLTDGQTPETIAATWATTTDPLLAVLDGPNTEPATPRPHPPAFTGHHQPPRNDQLNTTGIAAARAAIRGTTGSSPHQPPRPVPPRTDQE